jgi:VIT1/CCC1 family predicted Fe2+/Mn2+ transporter
MADRSRPGGEKHRSRGTGWLRAAVLGSNDAIVSTASLTIGVAAAAAGRDAIVVAGLAGIVAGSLSMALGEFVSVSSQRDAENADIEREKRELEGFPQAELRELATIYMNRGLDADLAMKVAKQLTERDQLGAHLRDELGFDADSRAKPLQAAWISALSFATFGMVPMVPMFLAPASLRIPLAAAISVVALAVLGALGGRLGGAPVGRAALRVTIGGALAMLVSAAVGHILGVSVG